MYSIKSKWIENPIEENKKNGVELLQNSFPNLKKEWIIGVEDFEL